jgi:hypothetical protein
MMLGVFTQLTCHAKVHFASEACTQANEESKEKEQASQRNKPPINDQFDGCLAG